MEFTMHHARTNKPLYQWISITLIGLCFFLGAISANLANRAPTPPPIYGRGGALKDIMPLPRLSSLTGFGRGEESGVRSGYAGPSDTGLQIGGTNITLGHSNLADPFTPYGQNSLQLPVGIPYPAYHPLGSTVASFIGSLQPEGNEIPLKRIQTGPLQTSTDTIIIPGPVKKIPRYHVLPSRRVILDKWTGERDISQYWGETRRTLPPAVLNELQAVQVRLEEGRTNQPRTLAPLARGNNTSRSKLSHRRTFSDGSYPAYPSLLDAHTGTQGIDTTILRQALADTKEERQQYIKEAEEEFVIQKDQSGSFQHPNKVSSAPTSPRISRFSYPILPSAPVTRTADRTVKERKSLADWLKDQRSTPSNLSPHQEFQQLTNSTGSLSPSTIRRSRSLSPSSTRGRLSLQEQKTDLAPLPPSQKRRPPTGSLTRLFSDILPSDD